jgi:hypothetical protein
MRFSRAKPTGSFRVLQSSTRRVASHDETLQGARKSAAYWISSVRSPMEIQERFPSGTWITVETVQPESATSSKRSHARRKIHQEPTGRVVFAAHERGHHITTAGRRALERDQFALPPGPAEKRRGIKGRLPIDTLKRAHAALTRASMMRHKGHITARALAEARRAVHHAWPSIEMTK